MAATTVYAYSCLVLASIVIFCSHMVLTDEFADPDTEGGSFGDIVFEPEKRYAMLSSGFGGNSNRYNRYYYWQPWKSLPNRRCFRQRCYSNTDCCRHHNICDKSAKICMDCWRGYQCKTSKDCCARYPFCNSRTGGCSDF